jgi:hypothetical protein
MTPSNDATLWITRRRRDRPDQIVPSDGPVATKMRQTCFVSHGVASVPARPSLDFAMRRGHPRIGHQGGKDVQRQRTISP